MAVKFLSVFLPQKAFTSSSFLIFYYIYKFQKTGSSFLSQLKVQLQCLNFCVVFERYAIGVNAIPMYLFNLSS